MLLVLILIEFFQLCASVIYHLNDTAYNFMPPLYDLEKYDTCLQYSKGIYCLTQIDLLPEPNNELIKIIQEYSQHITKHYNHSKIERGVCLTNTCRQFIESKQLEIREDLEEVLAKCINESLWNEYGLQGKVTNFFCKKHNEESQKDIFDWFVLLLLFAILILNVAGTICDVIVGVKIREESSNYTIKCFLLSFSIIQNWNWIVSSEPKDSRLQKLKGIHGVKTIIMYVFIIGHTFYVFHGFTENPHQFEKFYEHNFYKMLFNGLVSVQIIFFISGFLLFYHLLLQSEKRAITWNYLPKAILLRFCRLAPATTVYVLFSATWLRYWSSGPIWKMLVTERMSGDCRKYWWSHLLFINNYFPGNKYCVVQNWQVAAEFQLFVLGICVFIATRHRGRMVALITLILLGMSAMGLHIWWQDLDAFLMATPEFYRTFDGINLVVHKFSHVNLPGFAIGMLAAQIVYKWQKHNVEFTNNKTILSMICHCIIPLIMVLFYSGSFFYTDDDRASLYLRIVYGVLHRPVMAILAAYIIIAMIMRFDDFWVRFLEWDGWVVPSRLTYSVSLIHTFFLIVLFGSRTQLMQITVLNHTLLCIGVSVLSFLAAIPYCLLIEAPFNKFLKVVVSKQSDQRKKVE